MKNHLFIGLGGQGAKSLAELRKVMKQRHQDVKSLKARHVRWDFLSIDSSADVWNDEKAWRDFGDPEEIALSDPQKLKLESIAVAQSVDALSLRPDIGPWIGQREAISNTVFQVEGANQRRRFGRLLFAQGVDKIRNAIFNERLEHILQGGTNECWFHVFASLAGGTGSGGIVDLVTMLRAKYPNNSPDGGFPIFLYLYVTSDDVGATNVGYFYQNQYAALRDLNALACGSFSPHQLGGQFQGTRFAIKDCVSGICISTGLNSENKKLPINTQIRITAESCFERLFAFNSGYLSPESQRGLTLQDIIQAFPGEPLRSCERSYRFASLGMRRWEVPNEKIKELLALDLMASSIRQMLSNNWQAQIGYVKEAPPIEDTYCQIVLSRLHDVFTPRLILSNKASELKGVLSKELIQVQQGISNTDSEDSKLATIETYAAAHYGKSFAGGGISTFFNGLHIGKETNVDETITSIDAELTSLWLDPVHPVPLCHILDILERFEMTLRAGIAPPNYPQIAGTYQKRRQLRVLEWTKLTWLSSPLKEREMLRAHMRDLIQEFSLDIDRRAQEYDDDFKTSLVSRVQGLRNAYLSARIVLSDLLADTEAEILAIASDLSAMQDSISANKYEFDYPALKSFRDLLAIHFDHQHRTASDLRSKVAGLDWGRTLRRFRGKEKLAKEELDDALRAMALQRAQDIHMDLNDHVEKPVLNESLMDRLAERFGNDAPMLSATAREFVNMAATCAKINVGELQPAVLLGGGVGVPPMPRRLFVLGLPQHPFSEKIKAAFINAIPAGANYVHDVYIHNDPSQLRLLLVDYWMAARFVNVTHELNGHYKQASAGNALNSVLYFCNIDPEGEQGLRADLLMPSPERQRAKLEAELWLGKLLSPPPVVEDERGLHLITKRDDGEIPQRLGNDLPSVVRSADIPLMFAVGGEIGDRLRSANGDTRTLLRSKVSEYEKEIRDKYGVTSSEFQNWATVRGEINRLLN